MRSWPIALALLVLVNSHLLQAQRPDLLAGLDSIRVVIEPLSQAGKNAGLSEQSLKADIELRLRETGTPVSEEAVGVLYVDLNVVAMADVEGYVFSQRLTLNEMVFLVRHATDAYFDDSPIDLPRTFGDFVMNQPRLVASTWETVGRAGTTSSDDAGAFMRDRVLEDVDAFVDDYLAGNPR